MKRNPKSIIAFVMSVLIVASAMVFGNVSAAEVASKVDSYDSLVESYGTAVDSEGRTDGFVYVGLEFYEEDGKLTDYFVRPGDKLTVKLYLKSNMYSSDARLITLFDNQFFDVKVVSDGVDPDNFDENGYMYMHNKAEVNRNHPMVTAHKMKHSVTTKDVVNANWIANLCGFSAEYLSSVDLVDNQSIMNSQTAATPYEMTSDEWVFSYYVHVKNGLAEGTKGIVDSPAELWQSSINPVTGKHDTRKQAKVPVRHKSEYVSSATDFIQMAMEFDKGTIDYLIIDDMHHEFVIGEAAVETTRDIKPDRPSAEHTTLPAITTTTTNVYVPGSTNVTRVPETTVINEITRIEIKTPSVTEIKYGDSIILHAAADALPEGAKIEWSADNSNFIFSCSKDRLKCTIHPKENGSTTFTAKVIDKDGNVLCEDDVIMTSKAGILWKIIAFFKQLFGLNRIIPECIITL